MQKLIKLSDFKYIYIYIDKTVQETKVRECEINTVRATVSLGKYLAGTSRAFVHFNTQQEEENQEGKKEKDEGARVYRL